MPLQTMLPQTTPQGDLVERIWVPVDPWSVQTDPLPLQELERDRDMAMRLSLKLKALDLQNPSDRMKLRILVHLAILYTGHSLDYAIIRPFDITVHDQHVILEQLCLQGLVKAYNVLTTGLVYVEVPDEPVPYRVFQNMIIEWTVRNVTFSAQLLDDAVCCVHLQAEQPIDTQWPKRVTLTRLVEVWGIYRTLMPQSNPPQVVDGNVVYHLGSVFLLSTW